MLLRIFLIVSAMALATCSKSAFQTGVNVTPFAKEEESSPDSTSNSSTAIDEPRVNATDGKETDQSEGIPGYFVDPVSLAMQVTPDGVNEKVSLTGSAGSVVGVDARVSDLFVIVSALDAQLSTPAALVSSVLTSAKVNADGSFAAAFTREDRSVVLLSLSTASLAPGTATTLNMTSDARPQTAYIDFGVAPTAKQVTAANSEPVIAADAQAPAGPPLGPPPGLFITGCVSIAQTFCDAHCAEAGKVCVSVGADVNGSDGRTRSGADCASGDFTTNNSCNAGPSLNFSPYTRCRCDDQ